MNIITGKNAQGKTNLLEAIFFNLTGYSYRTSNYKDLINWNSSIASVSTIILKDDIEHKQCVAINKDGEKKIKINEVEKKNKDIHHRVVIFTPNDLNLIKGSSAARRDFFDKEAGVLFGGYRNYIRRYNRVLINRNRLLKNTYNKNSNELKIWTEYLVQTGTDVLINRLKVLNKITPFTIKWHSIVTGNAEKLEIRYLSCLKIKKPLNKSDLKSQFLYSIESSYEEEIKKGYTVIGPHRDDIVFLVNGKNIKKFGSQGQHRTVILCLKLALISLYINEYRSTPILLMDDVFFELDKDRQKMLLYQIQKGVQTFITTNYFEDNLLDLDYNKYFIKDGNLSLVNN